jgi:hypothetical protein
MLIKRRRGLDHLLDRADPANRGLFFYQIDTAGAVGSMPTPAILGTPGWFNPTAGGGSGTVVSADWLNAIQAEFLAVLAAAEITPSKTVQNQLLTAIVNLIETVVPHGFQVFSTVGTSSWNIPTGVNLLKFILCWGGGGDGTGSAGGSGNSGAGGGFSLAVNQAVTPGASKSVTIGAAQSSSSFDTICSATGATGTGPGSGVGGALNANGAPGTPATYVGGSATASFPGGGAAFGGPGGGLGSNGAIPGGGGGGPDGAANAGLGAQGLIIVVW